MNTLHELLEHEARAPSELFFLDPIAASDKAEIRRVLRSTATKAMCFYIDNVEVLEGMRVIRELTRLPYQTCWFEFRFKEDDGSEGLIGAMVAQIAAVIQLHWYRRVDRLWAFQGAASFPGGLAGSFEVVPALRVVADQTGIVREIICLFLSALHCTNVQRVQQHPSVSLQKARARRGKAPLFSYWTLVLKPPADATVGNGGTHASPRLHLRRGHPRQYLPGKWTWVQPHTVGNKQLGIVHKDYLYTGDSSR